MALSAPIRVGTRRHLLRRPGPAGRESGAHHRSEVGPSLLTPPAHVPSLEALSAAAGQLRSLASCLRKCQAKLWTGLACYLHLPIIFLMVFHFSATSRGHKQDPIGTEQHGHCTGFGVSLLPNFR
ncbi:RNA pseudouridine synthase 4, mitochondrial [Iris pallida]|uniref:RNA pseudouridine synthase 4, mitochondrial n=1 Tax=Iris pallida TaxID=29817 RepID=A0AAX6FVZ6_IRIPA|nr:RNA pseudouridine synthase 4, mitochondrial [Iris pallida]